MSIALDPQNLDGLKNTIAKSLGFDCTQYSDAFTVRRLEVRLRALKIDKYADYIPVLINSVDERSKLRRELTIHTTNFYRDVSMWDSFREKVIPVLADRYRRIRVWSAGCSTGEEPLTIAMCLLEGLGSGARVEIVATDFDEKTIAFAQEAQYGHSQFRELPKPLLEKYFSANGAQLSASASLKRLIRYEVGDLFSPQNPSPFDIIFCRNTVIYFGKEAKAGLYTKFYDCLNPGGFLVLGKTELLAGEATALFAPFDEHEHIYRKPE